MLLLKQICDVIVKNVIFASLGCRHFMLNLLDHVSIVSGLQECRCLCVIGYEIKFQESFSQLRGVSKQHPTLSYPKWM
jgi:hypothetical protein